MDMDLSTFLVLLAIGAAVGAAVGAMLNGPSYGVGINVVIGMLGAAISEPVLTGLSFDFGVWLNGLVLATILSSVAAYVLRAG